MHAYEVVVVVVVVDVLGIGMSIFVVGIRICYVSTGKIASHLGTIYHLFLENLSCSKN
jgi:hypothetical protein